MENTFQKIIANKIAEAVNEAYGDRIGLLTGELTESKQNLNDFIYAKIEIPKDSRLGDFAFPTFVFSKPLKQGPPQIAEKLAEYLDRDIFTVTGAYLNAKIQVWEVAEKVLPDIYSLNEKYGEQTIGDGRKVVIDFSSPNIAKPFGVGHLRSTAIGNCLYRVYKKLGFESIGINHLGDWGTQFGKLIVAFKNWGDEKKLKDNPIQHLFDIYVKFHTEEESDPELGDEARLWFKKLEEGDEEAAHLWLNFRELSMQEFQRIYDILDVHFDHYTGESFYNDKTEPAIELLRGAGMATESQGALVVDLEKYGMPPCLLKKADGATLYATRDIAGILFRHETYDFYKALYVVGSAQQEHFRQVFKVMELLDECFIGRLEHIGFGWIRFQDQAMSTRKGNIVLLDDVIETARKKAAEIIKEKNPELDNLEETAEMVALGAILFADLNIKRHKDVNFRWEEVLNFEGETGPYLQYTHARLCALIRRWGSEINDDVDFNLYKSREEKDLILHLYRFGEIIELTAAKNEPDFLTEYLLELSAIFNRFYQRKDEQGQLVRIISDDIDETQARMLLVAAARIVLKEGLYLLGIKAPEQM